MGCGEGSCDYVLDSGSNMIKEMDVAELTDFSCCAHTLQLLVNDEIASHWVVKVVIDMLKTCGNHFLSIPAKNRLKEIQKDLDLPEHAVIQATPTHWNSHTAPVS